MNTYRFGAVSVLAFGAAVAWLAIESNIGFARLMPTVMRPSVSCGTTYVVARGDTLSQIAQKVYGTSDYHRIFEANRRTLTSAAHISVGDRLVIPCRDGVHPVTAVAEAGAGEAAAPEPPQAVEAAVAAAVQVEAPLPDRPVRYVTGSDFAPFAHAALPEAGMASELVRLAMAAAAPKQEFGISLVNDWSTHLDRLEGGGFDLGFPWYRPDCAHALQLAPEMRRRCTAFDFSEPLFEIAVGYYVRQDDPLAAAADYDALKGHRICRPATHFTFDLEQQGLARPETDLVFPASAADCFALLESGAVDVVTAAKSSAEPAILLTGMAGRVDEIPALASRQTLHVIAPKGHPHGRAYLDMVDAGLAELRESGRWSEVASRHLGAFGLALR